MTSQTVPAETSPKLLVALASFGFFVFGCALSVPGALLPVIIEHFEISLLSAGTMMAAAPLGYLLAVAAAGWLSDRYGGKIILAGGVALAGVGAALFGYVGSYGLAVVMLGIGGVGGGAVELVANILLIDASEGQSGRYLNFGHLFFGVGAFVCPPLATYAASQGVSFATVFLLLGGLYGVLAAATMAARFPNRTPSVNPDETATDDTGGKVAASPIVLILSALLGVYVGFELGIGGWLTKYLTEVHGSSLVFAGNALSAFWLSIAAGRLVLSIAPLKFRDDQVILVLSGAATLLALAGIAAESPWGTAICFAGVGLGCSGVYPLVIAWGGSLYPSHLGLVTGVLATGGAVGAVIIPWIMSAAADRYGLRIGMLSHVIAGVVLLSLILIAKRLKSESP